MTTLKYKLDGLDCEHCAARLEKKLAALEGIEEAQVLYPDCICILKTAKEEAEIEPAILHLIKEEEPEIVPEELHEHHHEHCDCHEHHEHEHHHDEHEEAIYYFEVKGVDCAGCAKKLEEKIATVEGLEDVSFNYDESLLQYTCAHELGKEMAEKVTARIAAEEPEATVTAKGHAHVHHDHDHCDCHEHHEHDHHHDEHEEAIYYFEVKGVDCAGCAKKLEEKIAAIEGLEDVSFNYDKSLLKYTCAHDLGKEMAEKVTALIAAEEPEAAVTAKGHAHVHRAHDHCDCHEHHEHEHHEHHHEKHHFVTERTKRFSITGIDCADCAAKLERHLEKIAGIENVSISFMNSTLMYDCDAEDNERIEQEIRKITAREEPEAIIAPLSAGRNYQFRIHNIDCADCADKLARKAGKISGVISADADFIHEILNVACEPKDLPAVKEAVIAMVQKEEPEVEVSLLEKKAAAEKQEEEEDDRVMVIRLIAGAVLFLASLFVSGGLQMGLSVAAWLVLGYDVLIKAVRGIGRGQVFDEHFLMAVATIAAIYLKDYREAAGVMLFYQIGEYFQDMAVRRSRRSIGELMDIRSEYAMVLRNGEFQKVDPEEVSVGETIRVVAGEKIPLDGVIVEGASSLNTASLTGESRLRDVDVNDEAISGALNMNGTLLIRVSRPYSESTVAKILELVENAESRKSSQEKFITKFSRYYTPLVVFAAIITATVVAMVSGDLNEGIYRACTFLVISCPCALVISIPLSFFAGIGGLSGQGVLIKGANLIEDLSGITHVIMDKTGTLTSGSFAVSEILDTEDPKAVLKDAAYAEHISNHPLALGILAACEEEIDETLIRDAEEIAGRGLKVTVSGETILAGNEKLMQDHQIDCPSHSTAGTVVYVARNNQYEGCLVLRDQLKETAKTAVRKLQENGRGCYIVSGDSKAIVEETNAELGCRKAYGECLPQDKVKIVEELKSEGKTAFVGDGVNDAPVLAAADIGMAMGALGSDAAIEAADVVIMDDNPEKIALAIDGAGRILKVARQNIYGAISIKILTLILGAFGIANMWMAIFADTGVAMLCVLNAMRLLYIGRRA